MSPKNLFIVTANDHQFQVADQLSQIDPELMDNIYSEPTAKNTLPAIAWATLDILNQNKNALIGVFPSDHIIFKEDQFCQAWETAEISAKDGFITLLGVKPKRPASDYGYIEFGEASSSHDSHTINAVIV